MRIKNPGSRIKNEKIVRSPAKVNLFLEVLGKRSDGYHDLATVFQEIDLADEIHVHSLEQGIEISSDSSEIPTDSTNLVYRAADLFLKRTGIRQGVHIHIVKRIPVAAGLGGGSSNAAATLKALQEFFQIHLELGEDLTLARSLGADVAFFLKGGTALGRGIGDQLQSIRTLKPFDLVLVNPLFKVSTAEVYQGLSLVLTRSHFDITLVTSALQQGQIRQLGALLFNRLEDVVFKKYPQLGEIKETLKRFGALGALLSGSGPTLFAIAENRREAQRIKHQFDLSYRGQYWTALCESR